MAVDALCCLCQDEKESHHHFFFDCSYFTRVWQNLVSKNRVAGIPNNMGDVLDWLQGNVSWDSFRFVSLKYTLAATVYGLWQERNSCIFCAKMKDHIHVATDVSNEIHAFLSSRWNVKQSLQNRSICEIWGLSHRIMQSV
ncbi:hypothetical protein RHMOL_Rhmol07G0062400 [Rhododendron molle]|uniref:Uncharacterized protein n=1 Tax=Rhododendron molle TaxID=49168 RepID=A0ACC0MXH5_RHOML|nr:hypothetical protein RHMOL_Rhmol07G0062400 [Rhododendron molle]